MPLLHLWGLWRPPIAYWWNKGLLQVHVPLIYKKLVGLIVLSVLSMGILYTGIIVSTIHVIPPDP